MRLSLMKGAHAVVSSAARRKLGIPTVEARASTKTYDNAW